MTTFRFYSNEDPDQLFKEAVEEGIIEVEGGKYHYSGSSVTFNLLWDKAKEMVRKNVILQIELRKKIRRQNCNIVLK